jgi:uncharacterized protein (DUF1800 family)
MRDVRGLGVDRYRLRWLAGALSCLMALPAVAGNVIFKASFDEFPEGPFSEGDASRFLTQATFGPTLTEIDRVQRIGYNAWLNEQLALPPEYHLPFLDERDAAGDDIYQSHRQESWFTRAARSNDQLRQRVAYALSQILVVSDRSSAADHPFGMAHYYDALVRNAFGNYRTLLNDVTLHPVMGNYLSSLRNRKEDTALNIRPDENYAREIMQLFSIGLVMLNPDGTVQTSGGQPIPTYNQGTIRGFARVFTGWVWSGCPADAFEWCWPDDMHQIWWRQNMVPFAAYHETGAKQLLNYPGVTLAGGLLPAGGTANSDLNAALDNIFNHPNVGPFVARRLIQRLVTSNPSAAYVGRVAAKFNNNGSNVRGDLAAVVRAILLDPEARNANTAPANSGKLREPVLRLTQLWRALDARSIDNRYREWYYDYYSDQAPLRARTVFNFYLPDYQLPGEVAQLGLYSPEFQITTDTFVTRMSNDLAGRVYWYWRGNTNLSDEDVTVDLNRDMALANNPQALLDRYELLFMGGNMSNFMRTTLVNRLNQIGASTTDGQRERVQDALWLIHTAPEFVIER